MSDSRETLAEPARTRIVDALRWDARTVDDLAGLVELTPNGVRANLAMLERDGLVERVGVRAARGAGKPPVLYRLSSAGEERDSRAYPPALTALIQTLLAELGPAVLEHTLTSAGASLAASVSGNDAASILSALGARVRTAVLASGAEIVEGAACPLSGAVRREPMTCELVRSLLAARLGSDVVTQCRYGDRPRCRFEVNNRVID